MYLISQVFKKGRPVGKYYCQVFYCSFWNLSDLTEDIAKEFGFTIKNHSIEIWHWSGTGFQRIKEKLTKDHEWNIRNKIVVMDVSVFNQ